MTKRRTLFEIKVLLCAIGIMALSISLGYAIHYLAPEDWYTQAVMAAYYWIFLGHGWMNKIDPARKKIITEEAQK